MTILYTLICNFFIERIDFFNIQKFRNAQHYLRTSGGTFHLPDNILLFQNLLRQTFLYFHKNPIL